MAGERILVIDDEASIRKFLRVALEANGFTMIEAATGRDGLGKAATTTPDIVVLDLGLPDMDGEEVVKSLREWSAIPILILSVRDTEANKVAALDAGANDYVTKPFAVGELLARLRVLARTASSRTSEEAGSKIVRGALVIDLPGHQVHLGGDEVHLTRREFDLLVLLARNAGRLMTHRQLLRTIWGPAHEDDPQYLRVFVGRLRHKLGDDPAEPRFIFNEPGVGYRFVQ